MLVTRSAVVGLLGLVLAACAAPTDEDEGEGEAAEAAASTGNERGPTDDDPDRDADPDAPSPADDPRMALAQQRELIRRFAPHLHLHPGDSNRPANVDWYLARVSMRYHHNNCPDHEVLPLGKVNQASLIAQTHDDTGWFCRHKGNDTASTEGNHFFLEVADHATYKGAPRAEWKTYVAWRPQERGLVHIYYWFFYPFNDGFTFFNHESDWEHVRVTIDPNAERGQGKALEVMMSSHRGGTTLKRNDARLTMDGGTHPVVYTAKGSHANYPKPGTYSIPGTKGIPHDTAKAAPAADVWRTENDVVLVGTRANPKNGQVFIKYWGIWGERGELRETSGVTRHFL